MFKQPENIPPVTMRARMSFEKGDGAGRLAYRKSVTAPRKSEWKSVGGGDTRGTRASCIAP